MKTTRQRLEEIVDKYFPDEMDSSMYHPNLPEAVDKLESLISDVVKEKQEEIESHFGVTADHYGLLGDGTGKKQMFLFIGSDDWEKLKNLESNKGDR